MKRELKAKGGTSGTLYGGGFRRCPYEEGTESFFGCYQRRGCGLVSDAVPMKRELKEIELHVEAVRCR